MKTTFLQTQLLRTLQALSAKITTPKNYHSGRISNTEPMIPQNILCFSRTQSTTLLKNQVPHHHHRFVLIIALSGSGSIGVDQYRFFIAEGQAKLIFPYQFHTYTGIRTTAINWLFITFTLENTYPLEALRNKPSRRLTTFDLQLIEMFLKNWHSNHHPTLLRLYLGTLLENLPLLGKNKHPTHASTRDTNPGMTLLLKVNSLVMQELNRHRLIPIQALAQTMGYSVSHLRMLFRKYMGISLGRHLQNLRLQQAVAFINETTLPISEIAERCGFDSIYSFSRTFKNEFQISPLNYRNRSVKN